MPTLGNMKIMSLALMLILLQSSACATDPGPLDPTGNWGATMTWSSGDCHLVGSMPVNTTVVRNALGGLEIQGSPGHTVVGTALCSATQCQLSFTESGPGPTGIAELVVVANLTANEDEDIIGSGRAEITFPDGSRCTQQFIASGHKNIGVISQ